MTKTKKRVLVIKLVFGLALLLFIGWKISNALRNEELQSVSITENSILYVLTITLLMPINWLLETVKWHVLVMKIHPQKFKTTLADVLAGVSTSILTPNRIGNFIGRTTQLPKEYKTKAIIATIHSNVAQFNASIIFGTIGLLLLGFSNSMVDESAVQFSAYFVIALGTIIYLYPKILDFDPLSRLYSEQMKNGIAHIQNEAVSTKLGILLLSMLRYLVFLLQFYLLLKLFGAHGMLPVLIPAIALVYLITTIIPSFLFGKLFVREASALFVLEAYGVEPGIILLAVFFLWILNLAIPSLIGAGIIFFRN